MPIVVSHGEADHDPYKYSDAELEYLYGYAPPNYPVPALWDVYPDEEYLIMLYKRADLIQKLRNLRGNKQH